MLILFMRMILTTLLVNELYNQMLIAYSCMFRIGCKPILLITLTWLKCVEKWLKVVALGLWVLIRLKLCMSRVWPLGHDGSVLLSVVAQALLCIPFLCRWSSSLFRWCQQWLSVGGLDHWGLDSVLGPIPGLELPRKVFTFRVRWIVLTLGDNRLCWKHVLSFEALLASSFVNINLSCNNLTWT
jgi:hypothetical protein